jgi:hypothetical protein
LKREARSQRPRLVLSDGEILFDGHSKSTTLRPILGIRNMPTGLGALTFIHVAISLIAIFAGFVVTYGMLTARRMDFWTAVFLANTVLTSATGFLFPIHGVTPGLVFGVISMVLLAAAIAARYRYRLAGPWRATYVVCATVSFFLNFLVLIVQSFQKVPPLHALAPTQSEPPFLAAQLVALVAFLVLGFLSLRRFHVQ